MDILELILPKIRSPKDLRGLSGRQIRLLAAEIREELCQVSDKRSVHFASNMGVVELTIALHASFDFSHDRLIWDTGHQCYPHKLLTGRFSEFSSMRTRGGLMGFPNPGESEYDLMMTGHAGCSVGTALGIKVGDELVDSTDKRYSVAVVGDAAFASGSIFEAMGHAGWLRKNITIILNDNKMGICPRTGGISGTLDRLRMARTYLGFKHSLRYIIRNIPFANKFAERFLSGFKDGIKAAFIGGMLFEELGFRYIGPIDGHDVAKLRRYFQLVRKYEEPVLLHVFTQKGCGFEAAEEDPTVYHAPSPTLVRQHHYDENGHSTITSGGITSSRKRIKHLFSASSDDGSLPATKNGLVSSFTQQISEAVLNVADENGRTVVVTAAMTQGTMLEQFRDMFPKRFFDVGICESHAVIFAAGLAKAGMRPIVAIYSTFLQRSYDQIFQELSLQRLPVLLLLDRAGVVGADGPTHHGVFDIAYLRPFPNFVLMTPGDALDVEPMVCFAMTLNCPTAIRYPKADSPFVERELVDIELGRAERVREGIDGDILVCGGHLELALNAAKEVGKNLDGMGRVDLGVINARFIKPLDTEIIFESLNKGKFIVTMEEGMLAGGFGSAVLEAAAEAGFDTRLIKRIGIGDHYVEHAERSEQLESLGFTERHIIEICRELQYKIKPTLK
ncbi:MAG: 1-deoxy-D-xylulose-5-phosphate synthase [Planctomycetaceae bacterium]|jgi:1-deoxy-D-xylulose-5-phosphate synthase|nr:1-deoxy-D-xylulose-5-phosphate synthase [Planctomycetaceae bacterium]